MNSTWSNSYFDLFRQEKKRQDIAHDTEMTDLAPQVAEPKQGGSEKIKINEI